jgi:hypothetical protein
MLIRSFVRSLRDGWLRPEPTGALSWRCGKRLAAEDAVELALTGKAVKGDDEVLEETFHAEYAKDGQVVLKAASM